MQNLTAELSNEGTRHLWKKGAKVNASFAFPCIQPWWLL